MANLSNINNKFLVTTTGEVLIGQTSNNGNRLQITGADGASYIYLKTDVATTGGRIGFNGDDLRVFNQQASGELQLGTAGTSRVRISNSLVVFPTITELRGDIAAKFAIGNMGGASSQMMVSSRGFLTFNVSNTGSALDATERMRIDSLGQVKITSTGSANNDDTAIKFDINSTNHIKQRITTTSTGGYQASLELESQGNAVSISTAGSNEIKFNTSDTERMRITSDGMVGIGMTPNTAGASTYMLQMYNPGSQCFLSIGNGTSGNGPLNGLVIGNDASNAYIVNREATSLIFATSDANRMTILAGGNVGIGTNSPSYPLEVNGQISISSATGPQLLFFEPGRAYTDGMRLLRYQDKLSLTYGWNANEEALTVVGGTGSDVGNVGIGVTSPGNKLTIASGTGGGSAPDSRTLLHIDKNGEAYISINSPAESFNGIRLNVAGTPKAFMELYDNTAQGKKLNIGTVDARDLVFDTGNQPKMVILSGGNVGIGTDSPQGKLDSVAPVADLTDFGRATGSALNIRIANVIGHLGQINFCNDAAPEFGYGSIGMVMTSGSGVGLGDMVFGTKSSGSAAVSTERMRITSAGRVTINNKPNSGLPYNVLIDIGTGATGDVGYQTLSQLNTNLAGASDIRFKKNIEIIPNAIEKIKTINGYTFDWDSENEDYNYSEKEGRDVGVIAQEIQKVLPEVVQIAPVDRNEEGKSTSGNFNTRTKS
jgi:hypothetical protein